MLKMRHLNLTCGFVYNVKLGTFLFVLVRPQKRQVPTARASTHPVVLYTLKLLNEDHNPDCRSGLTDHLWTVYNPRRRTFIMVNGKID